MSVQTPPAVDQASIAKLKDDIYKDGICSVKGAFSREWTQRVRDEYEPLMHEARSVHRGTISRGPNRFYHAIYAERLSGFLDLITHPAFTGLSEAVLGPDYSSSKSALMCRCPAPRISRGTAIFQSAAKRSSVAGTAVSHST